MFLVVEVLNKCSCLGRISTIQIVGALVRDVASFAALETKTLSTSSVNVHGIGVAFLGRCELLRRRGGVWITTSQGESIEETCTRWCRWTGIRMVGGREVDTRHCGGSTRVIGLLMYLCLLLTLLAVSPLTIELDHFILPHL